MVDRGRPRNPTPAPDSYSSVEYQAFLARLDVTTADLKLAQEDRGEIMRAEKEHGKVNAKAHAFVYALRTAVDAGKLAPQDAVATLECVAVYAEWAGLTAQRDMFREQPKAAA